MQQTIAMLHEGTQFLKNAQPKNKADDSEEEDNDSDEDKSNKSECEEQPLNIEVEVPEEEKEAEDKELDAVSSVKDEDEDEQKEQSSEPLKLITSEASKIVRKMTLVKNYFKKSHSNSFMLKESKQGLSEKSFKNFFQHTENLEPDSNTNKEFKERNLKPHFIISALILSLALVDGDVRDQWVKLISQIIELHSHQPISKLKNDLTYFVRRCNMRRIVERHTTREY